MILAENKNKIFTDNSANQQIILLFYFLPDLAQIAISIFYSSHNIDIIVCFAVVP